MLQPKKLDEVRIEFGNIFITAFLAILFLAIVSVSIVWLKSYKQEELSKNIEIQKTEQNILI